MKKKMKLSYKAVLSLMLSAVLFCMPAVGFAMNGNYATEVHAEDSIGESETATEQETESTTEIHIIKTLPMTVTKIRQNSFRSVRKPPSQEMPQEQLQSIQLQTVTATLLHRPAWQIRKSRRWQKRMLQKRERIQKRSLGRARNFIPFRLHRIRCFT